MLKGWNVESLKSHGVRYQAQKKAAKNATLANSITFLVHYGISLFGNPVALGIYI